MKAGRMEVPGVSAGLVSSLPFNPSITLFAGGQFFNGRKPEFLLRCTLAFNVLSSPGK